MSLKRTRKPTVMHTIGHQTPAVTHMIQSQGGTVGVKRYRRRKPGGGRAAPKSHHRAKRGRKKGSAGKLVAGSAAAKAWGAKMRRKRKAKAG